MRGSFTRGVLGLAAAALVAGCGGGGGSSSPASVTAAYAGRWVGYWTVGGQHKALIAVNVLPNGTLNMVLDYGSSYSGSGAGMLDSQGNYHAAYTWGAGDDMAITGTIQRPVSGHLTGTMSTRAPAGPGDNADGTLDLTDPANF